MVLYDPINAPFRGIRTALDGTAIGTGFWALAENVRTDSGVLRLREGISLLANDGVSGTYTCIGATLITEKQNTFLYVALRFASNDVRIYFGVHNGTSWHTSLTESTAASGQFGNTRMNEPASGTVRFQTIYDTRFGMTVIAQNGVDAPRILYGATAANGRARRIEAVPAPKQALSPQFGVAGNLDITSASTPTSSGANFTASVTGSPQRWRIATGASAIAAGDTAQIVTNSGSVNCSNSDQLFVIATATSDAFFTNCKWELERVVGGDLTVHDPDNGLDSLVSVETNIPGFRLYAFPLGQLVNEDLTQIRGIKLTATNAGIPASQTLDIYTIAAGGRVPGNAEYETSHFNQWTQTESPSVVLPNFGGPQAGVAAIWGATASPLPAGFQLPISDVCRYYVVVPTVAPPTAQRDLGVDTVRLYRRDPGEEEAYLIAEESAATWGGASWAYTTNYISGSYLRPDTTSPADKDASIPAPGAYVQPVPIGQAMAWSNRFYVGTYKASINDNFSVVAVSDVDFPMRFRSLTSRPDTEGFTASLEAGEDIRAFAPASGSIIGASSVYAFTSRGIYAVQPPLIRRVASTGIGQGESLAENQGRTFWVDEDRTARRMGGNIQDISGRRVTLDGYSGAWSSAYWRDRYYLAVTEGSTRKVLVWSDEINDWESLDLPGVAPVVFLPWRRQSGTSLLFVDSAGTLYQYESGTQDAGSDISFKLTTGLMHRPDWREVRIGGSKLFALDRTAEIVTLTYTGINGITQTATASLDSSTAYAWVQDKQASGGDPGVADAAVQVSLECNVAGPFRLTGWELKDSSGGNKQRAT